MAKKKLSITVRRQILQRATTLIKIHTKREALLRPRTDSARATAAQTSKEIASQIEAEFKITEWQAQHATAKALNNLRQASLPDNKRTITPSGAIREFGVAAGNGSNIRRAAMLGYIPDATQDETGHWQFTVAAFKKWLDSDKKRKKVANNISSADQNIALSDR